MVEQNHLQTWPIVIRRNRDNPFSKKVSRPHVALHGFKSLNILKGKSNMKSSSSIMSSKQCHEMKSVGVQMNVEMRHVFQLLSDPPT